MYYKCIYDDTNILTSATLSFYDEQWHVKGECPVCHTWYDIVVKIQDINTSNRD